MQCWIAPSQIIDSDHIDAKRILLVVPLEAQQFLEVRALLLERLGRHQEALECALGPLKISFDTYYISVLWISCVFREGFVLCRICLDYSY